MDTIFADKFGGYNSSNREQLMLRSVLKGNAFEVPIDSAGRILLPSDLRDKAGIDRDVTIVGNTGFFEVWSEKRRAELVEEIDISNLLS